MGREWRAGSADSGAEAESYNTIQKLNGFDD